MPICSDHILNIITALAVKHGLVAREGASSLFYDLYMQNCGAEAQRLGSDVHRCTEKPTYFPVNPDWYLPVQQLTALHQYRDNTKDYRFWQHVQEVDGRHILAESNAKKITDKLRDIVETTLEGYGAPDATLIESSIQRNQERIRGVS